MQKNNTAVRNFRNYEVWKNSVELVVMIYDVIRLFPCFEKYGIADQLRRASVSISSNIAEGASRPTDKEFVRFLHFSMGSAFEVETQLLIANRLNYISTEKNLELMTFVHLIEKQLNSLISSIQVSLQAKS